MKFCSESLTCVFASVASRRLTMYTLLALVLNTCRASLSKGFLSQDDSSIANLPTQGDVGRRLSGVCAMEKQDCRSSKCCANAALTCYEKNEWWGECRATCAPGIDLNDAPEFRTPWSCVAFSQSTSSAPRTSIPAPQCAGLKEDCRTSMCCSDPALSCYEKNAWWGECKASCVPGLDPNDAEEFRTPWSCKLATPPTTSQLALTTLTVVTTTTIDASTCTGLKQDCRSTKCCSDPSLTCYEKNEWWGECKPNCVPGIDMSDAAEFRTPWSCLVVAATSIVTTTNARSPSTSSVITPICSGLKEDCRSTMCCSDPYATCYEKNQWWGECKASCVPGIDMNDAQEFRTPWSCRVVVSGTSTSASATVAATTATTMPPSTTTTSSVATSVTTNYWTTYPPTTTTTAPAGSPVARHGQLRVTGNKIVNQRGEPVQLRGMSFFWSQWQGRYWTEGAVRWLSSDWSVSVVRAAMGIEHDGYLSNPSKHKALAMTVVDAAIASGIYVIIDWHDHHAEEHTAESIAFFTDMAQKYAGVPNVLYETYNEPIGQSWSGVIKPYHEKVVSAIRKHSDNIVILGTRFYSQEVDEASRDQVVGVNLAYTIHFYAAAPAHGEGLRQKAKRALSNGVALFATEWGTCREWGGGNLDFDATQTWLDFLATHHISDANWAISNKGESASALRSSASFTGGWGAGDLTTSGTWVRASIRVFAGAVGAGFDQDHNHGNGDSGSVNLHCAAAKEDCQNERCCRDSNMKCYKKNQWYAACLAACAPGIHSDDPVEYQTPWSCEQHGQ